MKRKKIILRKENFGGIILDTSTGKKTILNPEEYDIKKNDLSTNKKNENVKLFDASKRGYEIMKDSLSSPMDMFFELTKKCNSSCKHCYAESNSSKWKQDEISFKNVSKIIRNFSDNGGFYIRLTGGEPTIREDFFDIVDVINDEMLFPSINTNGLYDRKKIEKILSKGIKDIRISLDGPEEINDSIRGIETYKMINKTLKNIAEFNKGNDEPASPTINVVLMKSNKDYIKDMIEIAQNYNFKLSFGLLRPSGRAEISEMLSPEEVVKSAYIVDKTRKENGLDKRSIIINYDIFSEPQEFEYPFPFDNTKCPLGSKGIGVNVFGKNVTCGYLTGMDDEWIGEDIIENDMLDLWYNSELTNKLRKSKRDNCDLCEYHVVKCNGGCPAVAYHIKGNINSKDPYCVKDVKISEVIKNEA